MIRISTLTLALAFCYTQASCKAQGKAENKKIELLKVDLAKVAPGAKVYRIADGEIAVRGQLIKRIELGKTTAIITYSNKTADLKQPRYTFRLIDAYGIEVASAKDEWILDSIKAGDVYQRNAAITTYDGIPRLLEFSGIVLPNDWATPVFVVIEGMEP